MEWCLEHARVRHNRSVDNIADLMGMASKWVIYKWLENGRLPAILIRPFEQACGIDYVTRFIGHSGQKLLIDIPTGHRASSSDINALQASFTDAVGLLLRYYDGQIEAEDTLGALFTAMEQLAWHQGTVQRRQQPEFDFGAGVGGEM
ncbi:hypothetical protein GCM10007160_25360 [Litchfieldella qijiaojingensis]|uniref:XRE family transcriptional regulator n=1 Tax=Litchfieldella qijiaojingensis TaxID=980347 RepID=A0ABQ2YWZ5_9GAMM|nr:hypothetical protein [Halomonas qijiaojingensis]GGX96665.1 hypothetical protein GCM10007160_25360 [Halomonas qijiaojingensis]